MPFPDLGNDEKSHVEIFDLQTREWRKQEVNGTTPSWCRSSFHAVVGNTLYLFGGFNDAGYSKSLYVLNLDTFEWQVIPESISGPTAKCLGGMVSFGSRLIAFGGVGTDVGFTGVNGATFLPDNSFVQSAIQGWNNAIHEFDIGTGEYDNKLQT